MFSNKVDLMETLISWMVCTTLFLLLRYSIVGTTITMWNCVDIMSARPDITLHVYSSVQYFDTYSVNLRSGVYFSVLKHRCFLHSSPSVCSVWIVFGLSFALQSLGGSSSFAFFAWPGSACLLSGNPNSRETTDQRKQALQIREKLFCRSFTFKRKRPSKKVLKQKFLVC